MSTKVAVIIGDYSNGWSDAWVVQAPTCIDNIKKLESDRSMVLDKMRESLESVIGCIESSDKINTKLKDEPCCDGFVDWFSKDGGTSQFCGKCGRRITEDRRLAVTKELSL